jgi:hypothetical protein
MDAQNTAQIQYAPCRLFILSLYIHVVKYAVISATPYRIVPTWQFARPATLARSHSETAAPCNSQRLLRSLLSFEPSCSLFSAISSLFFANAWGRGTPAPQDQILVASALSILFATSSELFVAFCNAGLLFSTLCELFSQKTPGVGGPAHDFRALQAPKFACLSSLPVQSIPSALISPGAKKCLSANC